MIDRMSQTQLVFVVFDSFVIVPNTKGMAHLMTPNLSTIGSNCLKTQTY